MKTREDLVKWFSSSIQLNQFDRKFITGLLKKISRAEPLSVKQSIVFEKIVLRYKKQLASNNIDLESIQKLQWKHAPVELLHLDDQTYSVQINDRTLICKFPYDDEMVRKVRELRQYQQIKSHWNRKLHQWETDLTALSFKAWYKLTKESGKPFEYCEKIQDLIAKVGSADEWRTRLVQLPSGYWVVNNISETLLKHLPIFNYSINEKIVDRLTDLGVSVSISQLPANIQSRHTLAQLLTNRSIDIKRSEFTDEAKQDLDYYTENFLSGKRIDLPQFDPRKSLDQFALNNNAEVQLIVTHYTSDIPSIVVNTMVKKFSNVKRIVTVQ